ncbi:MAG: hypothetical protein ABI600_05825 [Luteolibacter sp.]
MQHDTDRFNTMVCKTTVEPGERGTKITVGASVWHIDVISTAVNGRPEEWDLRMVFHCTEGTLDATSVMLEMEFPDWSAAHHVLMPSSAYNGNRFLARKIPYSPKLHFAQDIGPEVPIIISDVPRLEIGNGPSRIHDRSGSMATPAIGFHAPAAARGFLLLTGQGNKLGDYGFFIEENRDRSKAWLGVQSPVVRERTNYHICDSGQPSDDVPHDFLAGDEVVITCRVAVFACPRVQDLHDRFCLLRKAVIPPPVKPDGLPLSACFEVQEEKFNRLNFVPEHGYYAVGMRENYMQDWQIGWTGGMISTLPLLMLGGNQTRRNVMRNFHWLFREGISPSGLFWDSGRNGTEWIGGDIRKAHTGNWHLIRKSGDAVFYIVRQFRIMETLGISVMADWREGTLGVARKLADMWEKSGQFGQFVDALDGRIIVGGSTSGAIIPAALVHAADYFGDERLLRAAVESAEHFYQNFTTHGIACGGPGDALQNPDSESAYALVESYVAVWEATREDVWLIRAGEAARQLASWVVSYDFEFPPDTMFGLAGMRSTGSVYANTQNKHSAPGLCTASGLALLKLFRATGDPFHADLLADITRGLPQYLPSASHPLGDAPLGCMCERVNMTDWEGKQRIGETWRQSTWAETSLMLTAAEIPGLYVRPDDGTLIVFDQIEAEIIKVEHDKLDVRIHNPTIAEARIKIFVETSAQALDPLHDSALCHWPIEILAPGETKTLHWNSTIS